MRWEKLFYIRRKLKKDYLRVEIRKGEFWCEELQEVDGAVFVRNFLNVVFIVRASFVVAQLVSTAELDVLVVCLCLRL